LAYITELFNHYGYIVLYIALTVELLGLPTPGETLMTYCGFLVFEGRLGYVASVVTAASGVISGITLSYFLGRKLGSTFFVKYGPYIHLGPEKLDKTSKWFNKYGNGLLVIAYFIPGVRHITGYFSGVTKIPYKKFAINAYIGAFLWTLTFISLGKTLGTNWRKLHGPIKQYLIIGGIIIAVVLICIYIYKSRKKQITGFVDRTLESLINTCQTLGKTRVVLFTCAQAFIVLSILLVVLAKNLWDSEFIRFDRVIVNLTGLVFPQNFKVPMKFFGSLTSWPVLAAFTILIAIWINIKGKNKMLELIFLLSTVLGGEILEELLRVVFHRLGPLGLSALKHARFTFPSEQAFMSVVLYGFAAYIIHHYLKTKKLGTTVTFAALIICFLSGLSPIFFKQQYPSDVLAGYAFGDVWLSLNIILLEVFRILRDKPSIYKR